MSLTTDELNYLVWRYLQEAGLDTTAFALQDATPMHDLDARLGSHVPIGSLVNLVQKGILYSEVDSLVQSTGEVQEDKYYRNNFTLLHALGADSVINERIEPNGRFASEAVPEEIFGSDTTKSKDFKKEHLSDREDSPGFIKVLPRVFAFEPSTTTQWNPTAPAVLAYGLTDGRARITVLVNDGKESQQIKIDHQRSFASDKPSDITTLSWSPLGNQLITASEQGDLRLWSADGVLLGSLDQHNVPVILIKWSPDSKYVLSMDADNLVLLWDMATLQPLQSFNFSKADAALQQPHQQDTSLPEGHMLGLDATWIDSSRFIIPGRNSSALLFSITDRTPKGRLMSHSKPIVSTAFYTASQSLLTASEDLTLKIWNGSNLNASVTLQGHSQAITYAQWLSQDFVISAALDGSVRIWDARTGHCVFQYSDSAPITIAALSNDTKYLAIGTSEGSVDVMRIDLLVGEKVKVVGEYISETQGDNYVTGLGWAEARVVVGYEKGQSVVLKVE